MALLFRMRQSSKRNMIFSTPDDSGIQTATKRVLSSKNDENVQFGMTVITDHVTQNS